MITWDIYEIITDEKIHGVKMRGRLRKLSINKDILFLVENAFDKENVVRFALPQCEDINFIKEYLNKILNHYKIIKVSENVKNPVLSKLKINLVERYEL